MTRISKTLKHRPFMAKTPAQRYVFIGFIMLFAVSG
jgi:hypothetical protein